MALGQPPHSEDQQVCFSVLQGNRHTRVSIPLEPSCIPGKAIHACVLFRADGAANEDNCLCIMRGIC
jgi:hypothetical protein